MLGLRPVGLPYIPFPKALPLGYPIIWLKAYILQPNVSRWGLRNASNPFALKGQHIVENKYIALPAENGQIVK